MELQCKCSTCSRHGYHRALPRSSKQIPLDTFSSLHTKVVLEWRSQPQGLTDGKSWKFTREEEQDEFFPVPGLENVLLFPPTLPLVGFLFSLQSRVVIGT